jgi:hypothetical protein
MSGYSSNELFKVIDTNGVVNNNPKRMIPWEKLQEVIDDCAEMGVRAIQVTGGGEPTLHPNFNELAQKVIEKKMDLAVVTNGLLLNQKRANILANACWTRISVDAGKSETYAKTRRVPEQEFAIVRKNIQYFTSIPDRKVYIGIGFVVTKENHLEILEACQQFKEWGVENVRLSAVFQNDDHLFYNGIYDSILEQIEKTKYLNDDKFQIFNNFGSRYEDLKQGVPDYEFCGYMNFCTYIGGDQNVYTCCVNSYNNLGKIGSIKEKGFKHLWDSQEKQDFFDRFNAKKCNRCMFNEKNHAINELLREPRLHDNFV